MENTFSGDVSLNNFAYTIPDTVKTLTGCFSNCQVLSGEIYEREHLYDMDKCKKWQCRFFMILLTPIKLIHMFGNFLNKSRFFEVVFLMCGVGGTSYMLYVWLAPFDERWKTVIALAYVIVGITAELALYDGSNIYPITDQAKAMVGLYTDAVASFKSVATVPIGAAMLLNEKISEHRKLDVIYEDSKTRIKPLMSVCSEQFVQTDQVKFIKDFLEEIPRQQLFYCESDCYWTISNGVTNLYVPLTGMNVVQYSFEPVIRITVSETPGVKNAVTLLAKVGEGYVYLCSNKEERVRISKKRKSAQESYQSVYFDGFVEEMDSFDKVLDNEITLSDDVKNKLALCIGKKRYASVMPKVVSMTLRELIKTSYVELPSNSQVTKLMKFYKELA